MASQKECSMKEEHSERTTMSPEEIRKYRATVQQKSIDAIRAAEERYEKARQFGTSALHETKEVIIHGSDATTTYVAAKDIAMDKSRQGYDAARDAAVQATAKAKDVTMSAGESAADYAKQATEKARDTTMSTGKTAADHAQEAAVKAKDATVSTGKSAADHAREKAVGTKDATASAGQKATEYVSQKAGEAKETSRGVFLMFPDKTC